MTRTAILVDGAFFLKLYSRLFSNGKSHSPKQVADNLYSICKKHLESKENKINDNLYRILYYDCPPLNIKTHHPVTKEFIDFSKNPTAVFRNSFFEEFKKKRKVAMRLGYLRNKKSWKISSKKLKDLLERKISISDVSENDIKYDTIQKGTDIKIGVDITFLALKKLVDKIILVSGDSDFVAAAKLARREGIDFVLDPMWNKVSPILHEHVDGIRSIKTNGKNHQIKSSTNATCKDF
jgi:uncharacterized LabA/DUF88 family protein